MSSTAGTAFLRDLRTAELDAVLDLFGTARHVVEIGGGTGLAARALAEHVARVDSVDVAVPAQTVFPVQVYDGRHLPFADGSVDALYSSSVLEHVTDLDALLADMRRVLRPDGRAVHVVPNATWRLWTHLTHYPSLPRLIWRRLRGRPMPGAGLSGEGGRTTGGLGGPLMVLRRLILAMPHGEHDSALGELRSFSEAAWRARFEAAGWEVETVRPLGLFYTGYLLAGPAIGLPARRRLARLLGSVTTAFVVRPRR